MVEHQSVLDWLSDKEFELRRALEPVSLIVETNFDADEVRVAQEFYGRAARWMLLDGCRPADVIRKYPALTLTILVGHAAVHYDQGRYWDQFWDALDMLRDSNFENALRQHFAPLLEKFKLARYADLERDSRYVMMFALHAGMPANCVGDLLNMIDAHLVRGYDPRGAALVEWLEEPGKQHRSDSLDVPVRNFIRYGGPFALDILDRIFEFVESAGDDPNILRDGLETSTTGLPTVLLRAIVDQVRLAPLAWKGKRRSPAASHRRPALTYSADDDQIYVAVPYPASHPDAPWRISFDGQVCEVFADRIWGASESVQPPTPVLVPLPVREIVLTHNASGMSYSLQVVDKTDPLLTFDVDGSFVPRRGMLGEQAWAVYPSDSVIVSADSSEQIDTDSDAGGMPGGWSGWRSSLLDLSVDAIRLRRGRELIGGIRNVRRGTAAKFEIGERIEGCETLDGRAVYGSRPRITLPPNISQSGTSWRVRTRQAGLATWLVDGEWLAADFETSVDPFDGADKSQLGLFEIVVTGPLGADIRTVVFLAEGLDVTFDPEFRRPTGGGLSGCSVALECSGSLNLSDEWIEFGAGDSDRVITVSDDHGSQSIVLRPPKIEMRCAVAGSTARWTTSAEICTPSDFTQDLRIAVRLPRNLSVDFAFLSGAGYVVHVEQPRRTAQRVYDVAAQRFADTALRASTGHLVARVYSGTETVNFSVLAIQPPRLCAGMRLDDGVIVLSRPVEDKNLSLHIWRATAPWLAPDSLSVENGSASLPPDLFEVGDLICQAFLDDPWICVEPPSRPGASAARLPQPGWATGHSKELNDLSRYLAGDGPPPDGAGAMPEIWNALTAVEQSPATSSAGPTASALIAALTQQPRMALEGLGTCSLAESEKMALLVRTQLIKRDYTAGQTMNELHPDPWFGCLVEIADLKSLFRRRLVVREERKETIGYLEDKGGPFLLELLGSGTGAGLKTDCFDRTTLTLASWPPARVDELRTHLRLVPESLLDPDMRRAANFDAFAHRSAWLANGWSAGFARQCELAVNEIRKACPSAAAAIAGRNNALRGTNTEANPWILMCVQSLTLAVIARLEARGLMPGDRLDHSLLSAWSRLAETCPNLVATDILIAEALVTHSLHGDLVGEK